MNQARHRMASDGVEHEKVFPRRVGADVLTADDKTPVFLVIGKPVADGTVAHRLRIAIFRVGAGHLPLLAPSIGDERRVTPLRQRDGTELPAIVPEESGNRPAILQRADYIQHTGGAEVVRGQPGGRLVFPLGNADGRDIGFQLVSAGDDKLQIGRGVL